MNYKAAILKTKVAAAAVPEPKEAKEEPKEARTYRMPSYFAEDEYSYRVFTEEETEYLDGCSPSDRERVITLLKSGKLRISWDFDDDDPKATKATKVSRKVSRKGSVKGP
jgi:hypothetical protein